MNRPNPRTGRIVDPNDPDGPLIDPPGGCPEIDILDRDPIAIAVFGHYMETGEPAGVKDIAAFSGLSESAVRKRLREVDGVPDGCFLAEERRHQYRRPARLAPQGTTFRAVILALRQTAGALERELHPERHLEGRDAAETECP